VEEILRWTSPVICFYRTATRDTELRGERIREGERVYGYFPMSSHLVVQADRVSDASFVDAAPHRAKLPPVYNQYQRLGAEHRRELEDAQMLFRPLFMTSFVIDDFLARRDFFGAKQIVLSSASSKTSLSLAWLLSRRPAPRARVVGLTSPQHGAFVARTACYDQILPYAEVASLVRAPTVYVDMAGNAGVLATVHHHLGAELKHSCLVGATHWEARGAGFGAREPLPGPKPELFFAPDHIRAATQALASPRRSRRAGSRSWRRRSAGSRRRATAARRRCALRISRCWRTARCRRTATYSRCATRPEAGGARCPAPASRRAA
jgi:hypothetical protein